MMNKTKWLLLNVLLAFGAFSAYVLWQHGYMGIWQAGLASPASFQILLDLVISCGLICLWMLQDAKTAGRKAGPFIAITLLAGSFGPLLYLLMPHLRSPTKPLAA